MAAIVVCCHTVYWSCLLKLNIWAILRICPNWVQVDPKNKFGLIFMTVVVPNLYILESLWQNG